MNPINRPNVGTIGHIDHGKPGQNDIIRLLLDGQRKATPYIAPRELERAAAQQAFQPTHWPPRLTRMALAVRMGTTRMLLERK